MAQTSTDVLICGAGAAGLTLAVELARRGVAFRVIDKAPGPFGGSRGKGLQPRTQEVFDDLGVIDAIRAAGGRYPRMLLWEDGEPQREWDLIEPAPAAPGVPYPEPWMVPQWRTGDRLAARLNALGGRVEQGVGVTGLTQDDGGVRLTLSTGETVDARYVVGADGGRSTIRAEGGFGFPGTPATMEMFLADVAGCGLRARQIGELRPGGMVMSAPLGDGVDRIIVCERGHPPRRRTGPPGGLHRRGPDRCGE